MRSLYPPFVLLSAVFVFYIFGTNFIPNAIATSSTPKKTADEFTARTVTPTVATTATTNLVKAEDGAYGVDRDHILLDPSEFFQGAKKRPKVSLTLCKTCTFQVLSAHYQ